MTTTTPLDGDANDNTSPRPKSRRSGLLQTIAGYLIAAIALAWVFHGVDFKIIAGNFSHVNWPLAFVGMATDVGRYIVQSFRWTLLIHPFGKIRVSKAFQALYAGVFLNMVLPLRIGEAARGYLASHYSGAPFPALVSSLFVEYLIDGLWLALSIGAVALFVPLPPNVGTAARVLGAAIIVAAGAFAVLVFRPRKKFAADRHAHHWRPVAATLAFIDKLRDGLHVIGRSRQFIISSLISSVDLVFHILAFWLVMRAYGISLPFSEAAAVLLFVFVGVIIPNAPSNVGTFQILCVIGLMAFGIDKNTATGFSVLVFVLINIPHIIIGYIAFSRSGQTLYGIRSKVSRFKA
jgi:uncharacterized protein (TIRG00374 family)